MVSPVRVNFSYEVVRTADRALLATGTTVHATLDRAGKPAASRARARIVFMKALITGVAGFIGSSGSAARSQVCWHVLCGYSTRFTGSLTARCEGTQPCIPPHACSTSHSS